MAFSAERLIEEVRKREIYVSSLRTYKDTAMKEKAWEEVAAELGISEEGGEGIICIIFIMLWQVVRQVRSPGANV